MNKQIGNVKVETKNCISVGSVLSHIMHPNTKYLMVKTLAGKNQVVF